MIRGHAVLVELPHCWHSREGTSHGSMHNVTIALIQRGLVTLCMYAMQFVTSVQIDRAIATKRMLDYLVPGIAQAPAHLYWC